MAAPRAQVLTLANGDRILMTPQMKAFFEPENLANASPATVSRAGIIYVSDVELGWKPLAASWLQARRPAEAALLQPCFDKHVARMLDFVRRGPGPMRSRFADPLAAMHSTVLGLLSMLRTSTTRCEGGSRAWEPVPLSRSQTAWRTHDKHPVRPAGST